MTGVRTEEARALRWAHVVAWVDDEAGWQPVTEVGFDHERFAIYVWRSVRAHGDTKTEKSRRTLELPGQAADALRAPQHAQAAQRLKAAGRLARPRPRLLHQDRDRLWTRPTSAGRSGRSPRRRLGEDWTPRELRHSFVSIMSDNGVPIETIADLVGHASTAVTEKVYRHQLRPVITKGAEHHEHHLQPEGRDVRVRTAGSPFGSHPASKIEKGLRRILRNPF